MTPPYAMDDFAEYLVREMGPTGRLKVGPGIGRITVISPVAAQQQKLTFDRERGTGVMLSNRPTLNRTRTNASGTRVIPYTADVALSIFYPTMSMTPYDNALYMLPFAFEEATKEYDGTEVGIAGVDVVDITISSLQPEGGQARTVVVDAMLRVKGEVDMTRPLSSYVVSGYELRVNQRGEDPLNMPFPGVQVDVAGVGQPDQLPPGQIWEGQARHGAAAPIPEIRQTTLPGLGTPVATGGALIEVSVTSDGTPPSQTSGSPGVTVTANSGDATLPGVGVTERHSMTAENGAVNTGIAEQNSRRAGGISPASAAILSSDKSDPGLTAGNTPVLVTSIAGGQQSSTQGFSEQSVTPNEPETLHDQGRPGVFTKQRSHDEQQS